MANKSIQRIEGILQYYTRPLGADYNAYRNHVYRLYHLTLLYHRDDLTLTQADALAVGAAFHDIGIWTHRTMDYLRPSMDLADQYMNQNHFVSHSIVRDVILNHHRMSPAPSELSEAFRRADTCDISCGIIKNGLPTRLYRQLVKEFPYLGFHRLIIGKMFLYAIRHPFRPFPLLVK